MRVSRVCVQQSASMIEAGPTNAFALVAVVPVGVESVDL